MNKKWTNFFKHFHDDKNDTPAQRKNIFCCKNRNCDLWFSNPVCYSLGQYDVSVTFSSIELSPPEVPPEAFLNVLFNPVWGISSKTSFTNYNFFSIKIEKNSNVKNKVQIDEQTFLNAEMLKKTRSPSEKKICCCKTWTRVLWISSPVRYPLSQYDLFLEMGYYL